MPNIRRNDICPGALATAGLAVALAVVASCSTDDGNSLDVHTSEILSGTAASPNVEEAKPAIDQNLDEGGPPAPSLWIRSAAFLESGDLRFPGDSVSELENSTHVAGGGIVSAVLPGAIIRQPDARYVPPSAFVNVVISITDPVLSTERFPGSGDLILAVLVDYGDTDVARQILDEARIDPSEVDGFPEAELDDVEYTYDDEILADAYANRVDDAVAEIVSKQQQLVGDRVIVFARSYEQDRLELRGRADSGDVEARALLEFLPDRTNEYYLVNPVAVLLVDPENRVSSIVDGAFDELDGLDYDDAIAAMREIVESAAT
jgi:hypothetical protein